MNRCLDEQDASSLIANVVTELGVTNFQVRSDGPFSYPLEEEDAVLAHVEAGCFVYTGVAHDENGKAIYFVSQGPTGSPSPSASGA
jgi:hypothetical protein